MCERRQQGLRLVDKCCRGANIDGTLVAIEYVLFKRLASFGRQLVQQVALSGHLFYCLAMIHQLILMWSHL
jgi:hypothetical protein